MTPGQIRERVAKIDTWRIVECFHGTDPSPLQIHTDAAEAVLQLVLDVVDGLTEEQLLARHAHRVGVLEQTYGTECGRETRE